MLLSEFIKNCQETLEREGDGEIKRRSWCVDGYNYYEPEIEKDEAVDYYIIY